MGRQAGKLVLLGQLLRSELSTWKLTLPRYIYLIICLTLKLSFFPVMMH